MYEYYQRKVTEKKTKKQALVCVMRRLVNIIYGMMRRKTAYIMPAIQEKQAVWYNGGRLWEKSYHPKL